jgi:hypothetical protein
VEELKDGIGDNIGGIIGMGIRVEETVRRDSVKRDKKKPME